MSSNIFFAISQGRYANSLANTLVFPYTFVSCAKLKFNL